MITFSLQSGSNGNAIYVETAGVRLLFDAGISGRQAALRMSLHRRHMQDVDALIISHDHVDHVRGAGVFHRKWKFPVFLTEGTHRRIRHGLGVVRDLRHFRAGDTLEFGMVRVYTFRTPHDAIDGVAFVVESGNKRLGIFTDLGHPFAALQSALESVDAAYLESNYDVEMLSRGPYPAALQARIRGDGGHLSNDESAQLLVRCGRSRPKWVALAHLSAENNLPELALQTNRAAVGRDFPFALAGREGVSEMMYV